MTDTIRADVRYIRTQLLDERFPRRGAVQTLDRLVVRLATAEQERDEAIQLGMHLAKECERLRDALRRIVEWDDPDGWGIRAFPELRAVARAALAGQ